MYFNEIPEIKVYEKYPHIGRMMREANDLYDRSLKLKKYIEDHFSELSAEQRDLMLAQFNIMGKYHSILSERIINDVRYYYKLLTEQEVN